MIFLAGRNRYTQRTLLRDVRDRLSNQAACRDVRYQPSRRRPRSVVADVDSTTFLGNSHGAERARLEVRFWYPAGDEYEYYRLNWVEPERDLMLGFHRDSDHQNVGPCHVQLDYGDAVVDRHEATFLDVHPLAVLDHRLGQLPKAVAAIHWNECEPTLRAREG